MNMAVSTISIAQITQQSHPGKVTKLTQKVVIFVFQTSTNHSTDLYLHLFTVYTCQYAVRMVNKSNESSEHMVLVDGKQTWPTIMT